jgi:NHL repeat
MSASPMRRALCGLSLVLTCLALPAAARAQGSAPAVTTIAGGASRGMKDGPALQAQFLVPSGLARAKNGTLYISDPAAQRIREMLPNGTVRTVAGSGKLGRLGLSVTGGYKDGPALEAAFSQPAGLAVGPDGALYIADSFNACIRKLQNGVVSTVVGKPGEKKGVDGDAATARLNLPLSVSVDNAGTLWIADYGVGMRYFEHGELKTIKTKSYGDVYVTAIAAEPEEDGPVIAATRQLVYVYDRATKTDTYFGTLNDHEDGPFGRPDHLLAIGNGQLLFSDSQSSNIRYMRVPRAGFDTTFFTRTIAGGELEKGILNAGFADGSRQAARFYSPRGLALAGNSVIVADTGNHRLRRVVLPNFRRSEAGVSDAYQYDRSHYEVVYASASNAFWDTLGDDSICAAVERTIDASHRTPKPARCHTVRIDAVQLPELESYVKTALLFRKFDVLVLGANPGTVHPAFGSAAPGIPALHAALADLITSLKPTGARLVMMWLNDNYYFSNDENLVTHETDLGRFADDMAVNVNYSTVTAALRDLPLAQYDTYKDFLDYEQRPDHLPLFANPGTHLNPRGNGFLGDHLGKFLVDSGLVK